MSGSRHEGGCLCGAVRYAAAVDPVWVGHCHCRQCQTGAGAPVVTWMTVPTDALSVVGAPSWFRSSEAAERGFCPRCGSTLFWRRTGEHRIDVTAATLDDPAAVAPTVHTYTATRLPWLETADALPRYPANGPEDA